MKKLTINGVGYPTINELCQECHAIALDRGWYAEGKRNKGELIALIHSELSEALEAMRDGNPSDKRCPDYSALEVELADALIRIFDMAGYLKLDLEGALAAKMEINRNRPHRHGKAF